MQTCPASDSIVPLAVALVFGKEPPSRASYNAVNRAPHELLKVPIGRENHPTLLVHREYSFGAVLKEDAEDLVFYCHGLHH